MSAAESVVYDFAESTIWDNKSNLRHKRVEAVFELITFVKVDGSFIRREVRVDYTVFFDPEDEVIKSVLSHYVPEIDWSDMIYHRAMDSSRIFISPLDSFKEVAELRLRGCQDRRCLTTDELIERGVVPLFPFEFEG